MAEVNLLKFISDNILLVAVAAVSGGMLLWPALRRGAGGGPAVSTLEATLLMNQKGALVLDVREAPEYEKGHVLGSRNIPFGEIEARAGDFEKYRTKPVVIVCEAGNRSGRAVGALRKHGFEQVYSLAGGIAAWQQAGLPLEK